MIHHRLAFLDNLRTFLTVQVILVHTAITYGAPGSWFWQELDGSALPVWLQVFYLLFNAVNQAYFMGLFFLVAGYFTPASLERKGSWKFLQDRLLRLGLPLLAYVLFLCHFCNGLGRMAEGGSFWGTLEHLYRQKVYGTGPLWFAQALLLFSGAFLGWNWLERKLFPPASAGPTPLPSHRQLLGAALLTGTLAFFLRLAFPVGQNFLGLQMGFFASYVVLFAAGCRAARGRWLEIIEPNHAKPWVFMGLMLLPLLPIIFFRAQETTGSIAIVMGGWNVYSLAWSFWEPFVAWGLVLGLLWLTRQFWNTEHRFWADMAASAYAAFFLHAPILVGLSLWWRSWEAFSLVKWLVTGSATIVLSFGAGFLLRQWPPLRKVF